MGGTGFASDESAVAHVLVDTLTDDVEVGGDDGHHLGRVRRLRAGERVTAADGVGGWRLYEVDAIRRGVVTLHAVAAARREPELVPGLSVAFALTKGVKPETVVRQLTELGVDAVLPVLGERSVARPTGVDRLRRVAREALMQCRRSRLPSVEEVTSLVGLAGRPGVVVAAPGAPSGESEPAPAPDPERGGWTLVVGPEGGLAPAELEALSGAPRLGVGPHVLRAETAAVVAAALLTARRRPR